MRILSFDGVAWTAHDVDTVEAVLECVARDRLTWVRAGGLEGDGLERLGRAFGLHPLAIEDVQTTRQRPKVEDYPGLTFTVVRVPRFGEELQWRQVGLFLGPDFLITASSVHLDELDELETRLLAKGLPPDRCTVCSLFHQALDLIVDAWFPFMDGLEDELEEVEDEVLESASRELLDRIRNMKRVISSTRKVSGPMRDAMLSLERVEHPNILPETRVYLRDVSDHMVRLSERLDHVKEMVLIAQEAWNSTLAAHQNETALAQNEIMKRLTVVAGLLLVPTFLAGLGGMNFPGLPAWDFWSVTGGIFAFILVGSIVAAMRGWF